MTTDGRRDSTRRSRSSPGCGAASRSLTAASTIALDEMQFLPTPCPWAGSRCGSEATGRIAARSERAARWDGVVPEKVGGQLPTPDDIRDVIAFIGAQRTAASVDPERPFDVVIGGSPGPGTRGGAAITAAYAEAGATWWIERFHPKRGSLEEARRRVAAGPAR